VKLDNWKRFQHFLYFGWKFNPKSTKLLLNYFFKKKQKQRTHNVIHMQ